MALEKMINPSKELNAIVSPEVPAEDAESPRHQEAKRTAINLLARRTAKSLRFPNPVILEDKDHKFTIDGEERVAAGTYHSGTGEIKLYPKHIVKVDDAPYIMAHEIGHHKFNTVQDLETKEFMALDKNKAHKALLEQTLKVNSPSYHPDLAKHYPVAAAMHNAFHVSADGSGNGNDELAESDGVTKYSREWWEAHKKGTADRMQAVDETHAELSALHHDTSKQYDRYDASHSPENRVRKERVVASLLRTYHGVHPRWLNIHRVINEIYNDHMDKVQWKQAQERQEKQDARTKSKDK